MDLLLLHKEMLKYSISSQLLKCANAKTVYPGNIFINIFRIQPI